MTRLWQAFEESPCLMEVAEVWRRLLGTEFEQFRRFLMPTDIIAARYPGTDPRIPCRVIVEETGVIVVDDVSGQQHELSRSDVICHRVNMPHIGEGALRALELRPQFEVLTQTWHTTRIGRLSSQLDGRPVYFNVHAQHAQVVSAIDRVAKHAGRPYLLLHPTSRRFTTQAETLLRLTEGCVAAANELVSVDSDGKLISKPSVYETISRILGITFDVQTPRYQFKLSGKFRLLAFDSDPVIVSESAGPGTSLKC